MRLVKRALVLGAIQGVYSIASVYLAVEYLPAQFGWLVPAGGLAIPIAALWPRRADRRTPAGFGRQLRRRLFVVGAAIPVGALAAFLTVLIVPYSALSRVRSLLAGR